MRLAMQLTCAILVALGGYLLFASAGAPDGWPTIPDAQGETLPAPPRPSPAPLPIPTPPPADDSHDAAVRRSEASGRPLILLFHADWCPPCKLIEKTMLPAIRTRGELGIIDVDRQPDLVAYYGPIETVPHMMLYERVRDGWRFRARFMDAAQIKAWLGVRAGAGEPASAKEPAAAAKQEPQAAADCDGNACPFKQNVPLPNHRSRRG